MIHGLCARCLLSLALTDDRAPAAAPRDEAPLGAGISFGDYELLAEVARGGMGVVYKARQLSLSRTVALKILVGGRFSSPGVIDRFHNEVEASARLEHRHIVPIYDVGEYEGQHYFSMRFFEGGTLADATRRHLMSPAQSVDLMIKVARAVHHAHQRGVIHRDIKPANILLDERGEPHVADFGLAKLLESNDGLTASVVVMGTPAYMSPEQAEGGGRDLSTVADVYSLGAVMHELLSGRPPFRGPTTADLLRQIAESKPEWPVRLRKGVDRDLQTICLKCLEKKLEHRYPSADALADDLERWRQRLPITARPPGLPRRLMQWGRRKPMVAALVLVMAAMAAAALAGTGLAAWRINTERRRAEAGERDAQLAAYAFAINLAQRSLEADNLGLTLDILDEFWPASGEPDQRGWEWRYLWQQCQGGSTTTMEPSDDVISALAVSPDGKWLAVGNHHVGRISLREVQTGREVHRFESGKGPIMAAFSPTQPVLAWTCAYGEEDPPAEGKLMLWDTAKWVSIAELPLRGVCRGLAFSSDGATLLTATFTPGNQLAWWDVANRIQQGEISLEADAHDAGTPFAVTPDLRSAVHVMTGGRIRVLDLPSGKPRWTRQHGTDLVQSVAISSDGATVASGGGLLDGAVRLWNAASGDEIVRLLGHRLWVADLAFSPSGQTLVSAGADQVLCRWTLKPLDKRPQHERLRGHRQEVWRLELLPDGSSVVSGAKDGTILFWDSQDRSHGAQNFVLPGPFLAWRFSSAAGTLLTCDRQGQVSEWSGDVFRQPRQRFKLPDHATLPIFSPDGTLLAAARTEQAVCVWNVQEGQLVAQFATTGAVETILFTHHGQRLTVQEKGKSEVAEYDIATGSRLTSWVGLEGRDAAACSSDGRWAVHIGYDGNVVLRDKVKDVYQRRHLGFPFALQAMFSPDGKRFAAVSDLGAAAIWDTLSLEEVAHFRSVDLGLHSLAFSSDGSRLAVGGHGARAVVLLDAQSGRSLLDLPGEGTMFGSIAFSPDGNALGALNRQGALYVWKTPPWEEIATHSIQRGLPAVPSAPSQNK